MTNEQKPFKDEGFKDSFNVKLEKEITKSLRELTIPTNSLGFFYLRGIITLAYYNIEIKNLSNLYAKIAPDSTPKNVARTIDFAITTAWNRGNLKDMSKTMFGYDLNKKPTNKKFIIMMADYLKKKYPNQ